MNNKDSQKLEYNVQLRAKAGVKATIRVVVAAYIGYLGYNLIKGAEDTLFIVIGAAFIVAALGFCVYIWRRWRLDLEAARLPDTVEPDLEETDIDEDAAYESDTDDSDGEAPLG